MTNVNPRQPVHSAAEQQRASIVGLVRDAIVLVDLKGKILFANRGAEDMFGFDACSTVNRPSSEFLPPELDLTLLNIKNNLLSAGHWEDELCCTRKDGTVFSALMRCELERHANGSPLRILVAITDLTTLKHEIDHAHKAAPTRQSFESLFGHHPDGVFAADLHQRLVAVNPALTELTGYSSAELLSIPLTDLVPKSDLQELEASFREALHGKPQSTEFTCLHKDGTALDASMTLLPQIVDNRIGGFHGIVKDISHRKRDERRIVYLANHDALTGLPNRHLLQESMRKAIEKADRLHQQVGVLFMDLNRFKVINDSLGHDKGDMLLCVVAERLRHAIREVDTVARIGGDEFVIIMDNIAGTNQLLQVAKNLLQTVTQPITLDGNILTISTSIGGSVYPTDGKNADVLLKNADLAMYAAKDFGAGVFRLYAPEMNERALARLASENNLRQALARNELVLHFQPKLDLATNAIIAVEALVRWDHPQKGLIYPSHFVALAEETGMIDTLGEWVLTAACRQMTAWRQSGLRPIKVCVNMSALQLKSEHICATVSRVLEETDLAAEYLELEITESSLMQNLDASSETLNAFRGLGITLSIDDFGTGYSSLSYLKRLPVTTLKIDKSFIRGLSDNTDDAAIVSATIAMAHSLRLRVVAEGVTSFDQLHLLQKYHCDEIQGYLFCQPLPALEMESFFRTCELRGIQYSWTH